LGLPTLIIKSHPEEKAGRALGYSSSPIFGVPFNISVMAEDSDFKFGRELGFAKCNYKITPKDESGRGHHLRNSPKCGVPL